VAAAFRSSADDDAAAWLSIVSLIYSSLLLATNSFNPFIYFRF
jgi:hypothetical protein